MLTEKVGSGWIKRDLNVKKDKYVLNVLFLTA